MKRKAMILILCVLLLTATTVGGTLAYLFDQDTQVNTFTVGDVRIELTETPTEDGDEDPYTNRYWMLAAGADIAKDPVITVSAGSVDCWLFVHLEASARFDDYLTYTVAEGWTQLVNYPGVYFRPVSASDADQRFEVLAENKVSVRPDLTQAQMSLVTLENAPTLSVTGYAVQSAQVENPQQAWTEILSQTEA